MNSSPVEFSIPQVLPHEGRMRLLDELLSHDETGVSVALTVRPDSLLCDGINGVPAWIGMEYMAQAACAYSGVGDRRQGMAPRLCILLGTRSYQAQVPVFPLGARLVVTAQLVMRDDNDLAVFQCRILHGAVELASGDIKAIRPADIHALIREQVREPRNG